MDKERFWKRRILKEEEDLVKHILAQNGDQDLVVGPMGMPMLLPRQQKAGALRVAVGTLGPQGGPPAGGGATGPTPSQAPGQTQGLTAAALSTLNSMDQDMSYIRGLSAGLGPKSTLSQATSLSRASRGGGGAAGGRGPARPPSNIGKAPSVAGTDVSYPETPRFSDVASTVGTDVLSRLAKLEQELLQERTKREAAEQEMKKLLATSKASARPGPRPGSRGPPPPASAGGGAAAAAAAATITSIPERRSVKFHSSVTSQTGGPGPARPTGGRGAARGAAPTR